MMQLINFQSKKVSLDSKAEYNKLQRRKEIPDLLETLNVNKYDRAYPPDLSGGNGSP